MEPMRGQKPNIIFLKIRKIANKKNVLIFDEITSGFKDVYGGIHLKFNVDPDIAIFGKSIGNGYPISSIIGKRKIMECAQDTFISSTMWTDRLGFIAANETLKKLKKEKVNLKINKIGKKIKKAWIKIAKKNNINIKVSGLNAIPSFSFEYKNNKEISTFFIQEMLKKGFLANNTISISYAYTDQIIKIF